jgi:hypothetical protein
LFFGKQLDPRHRDDHIVVELEAVGGAKRGELAVHGRGCGLLVQTQGGVAQDIGTGHARGGYIAEEAEQLRLAVPEPLDTPA